MAVVGINTSEWPAIILLLFILISVGSIGLYVGPKYRKIMKSEKGKNIKYYDFIVIFLMVFLVADDLIFWFSEGRYNPNALGITFVLVSTYGNVGFSMFYYPVWIGSNRLIEHLGKIWRDNKNDAD